MEFLLAILIIALIVLICLLYSSKNKEGNLKLDLDLYKSEHKNAITELEKRMYGETINRAGEQFQQWRDQESEKIRLQQLAIARREAKTLLEQWKFSEGETIRADAIHRSQSVIVGKVTEHLIPYLPKFNYNPKDVRFFGDPIDLIVFDGLNDGYIKEIVFVEVKTGKAARLSRRQQEIRDAIKRGQIKWVSMRVNHDSAVSSPITIDDTEKVKCNSKSIALMKAKSTK